MCETEDTHLKVHWYFRTKNKLDTHHPQHDLWHLSIAPPLVRAALTEFCEDMLTDFLSLIYIFVCKKRFFAQFALPARTALSLSVVQNF